jgi:hypothetical protein
MSPQPKRQNKLIVFDTYNRWVIDGYFLQQSHFFKVLKYFDQYNKVSKLELALYSFSS